VYKLQPFDRAELIKILLEIFGLHSHEVEYVIHNLDTDVARILLELYFAELILLRLHRDKKIARWAQRLISLEEFLLLIDRASSWMKIRHEKSLLEAIFKIIDTNADGFISYKEFISFVRKYLGGRVCNEDFKDPFEGHTEKTEEAFYGSVWTELRALYSHYVKGKFLTEQEL
jgi:hypothetical protein